MARGLRGRLKPVADRGDLGKKKQQKKTARQAEHDHEGSETITLNAILIRLEVQGGK